MSDKKNFRWQYEVSAVWSSILLFINFSVTVVGIFYADKRSSQVGNILIIFKKSFNKFLFYGRYLETNKDKNFIFNMKLVLNT